MTNTPDDGTDKFFSRQCHVEGLLSGRGKRELNDDLNRICDAIAALQAVTAANGFTTVVVAGQDDVVADAEADTLTLVAGTNITLTTDDATDTITINADAESQSLFQTIAVAGESDVVADSTTDTLTLVAGTGISITTDAGTDTITITNTLPESGGGGAAGPYILRDDATALIESEIAANTAAGDNRYVLESATGVPITLPLPTGSGTVLEFVINLKATSNGYVFDFGVTPGASTFKSALLGRAALEAGAVTSVNATTAGNHNRITLLNGVAGTGGDVNDVIIFTDAISGQYQVSGLITVDTTTATFSAY